MLSQRGMQSLTIAHNSMMRGNKYALVRPGDPAALPIFKTTLAQAEFFKDWYYKCQGVVMEIMLIKNLTFEQNDDDDFDEIADSIELTASQQKNGAYAHTAIKTEAVGHIPSTPAHVKSKTKDKPINFTNLKLDKIDMDSLDRRGRK